MKKIKLAYLILLLMIISSCNKINNNQIVGSYEIDKYVLRDSTVKINDYSLLLLNIDNSFELKRYNKEGNIKGSWDIIK